MTKYTVEFLVKQLERVQRKLDKVRERKRFYKCKYKEEKIKSLRPNLRIEIPSPVFDSQPVTPAYMGASPQIENYPEEIELFPHNECNEEPVAPDGYEYVLDNLNPQCCSPRFGYKLTKNQEIVCSTHGV